MSTVLIKIKGFRPAEHLPWVHEPQYWLLTGNGSPVFEKIARLLQRLTTYSGWDRGEHWRTLRDFLLYDGTHDTTRRQLAKRVMLLLGMITSTEHFTSETCGDELRVEDIGSLVRVPAEQTADQVVVLRSIPEQ